MGKVPMIGQKLGSFKIDSQLGAGAMGIVYRGVSESTGRHVALKVLIGDLAQKGSAYERFKRESEILQQFRHPNIVRFLAVGRYQGTSYFAMEYVPGVTLDTLLEQRGYLPWQEVVHLGIQICDALHYAHQRGVVHRDLKPSNLMVSDKGQVKLTDFGIAKDLDATALTATGRTLGTAAYMAPEQIRGTPEVSHKTDLYSLGVVLYEMLTGEVPFQGSTAIVMMQKHLTEDAPRPSNKLTDIPLELDKLVVRLMTKDPTERPWDAAAVGMVLTELRDTLNRGDTVAMVWPTATNADGTMVPATPRKKPGTGKRKRKASYTGEQHNWLQTGLLVTALVVLVGIFGYMLWPVSATYLFHQAEPLMASDDSADWLVARKDYLDELDRRFPDNPYRKRTDEWRDRILLHQAERRAALMDAKALGSVSKPKSPVEETYLSTSEEAAKYSKVFNDVGALQSWQAFENYINKNAGEERGWLLLAHKHAEEIHAKMAERQKEVEDLLKRADTAFHEDRRDEALKIWSDIIDKYGQYSELREMIAHVRSFISQATPPAPQAESPAPSNDKPTPEATSPPPGTTPPK